MTKIDLTLRDKEAIRAATLVVTTGHAFAKCSTKMRANTITSIFEVGDSLRDIVERLDELELLEQWKDSQNEES